MSNPIDRVFRSNVKLRHLQLLVAIDEFRHIGRAAEFLSVTQPAISKTLAELEKLFGFALFDRSTRGTQPTPYGETVIRFARSVLADYERIRDEISAVASGSSGRTRVGAMVVIGSPSGRRTGSRRSRGRPRRSGTPPAPRRWRRCRRAR